MATERELSGGDAIAALESYFDRKVSELNRNVAEGETIVSAATMNGKIKKVIADKGFGFIRDETGTDRFFHRDQTLANFDALKDGDAVVFRPVENPKKGPRAEDVDVP